MKGDEEVVDNGDGTTTHRVWDRDGVLVYDETYQTPIPVEPDPDPVEALQAQVAAQQALIDELLAALGGGGNG
jgi:hypothetical protein